MFLGDMISIKKFPKQKFLGTYFLKLSEIEQSWRVFRIFINTYLAKAHRVTMKTVKKMFLRNMVLTGCNSQMLTSRNWFSSVPNSKGVQQFRLFYFSLVCSFSGKLIQLQSKKKKDLSLYSFNQSLNVCWIIYIGYYGYRDE